MKPTGGSAYMGKLLASGASFALVSMAAGAILLRLGLHAPAMPAGVSQQKSGLISVALSPLLALGIAPLAAGLSGTYRWHWLALALLLFVNLGVNTAIEAAIFTTHFQHGGAAFLLLMYAAAAVALSAVVARLFRPPAAQPATKIRRAPFAWAWRIALAVAAFPVIYFIFGSIVAPFVLAQYRAGMAGLVLPPLGVIVPVEVARSALFLLASLPVLLLWTRSRRGLVLALGWAHAVTVGLYGLLGAYWLPALLREAHSLEITADSFAYAFVLVVLLKPRAAPAERFAGPIKSSSTA